MVAVRTLKGVIEEQQMELQQLKKQNVALKAALKQTEEGRLHIQVGFFHSLHQLIAFV